VSERQDVRVALTIESRIPNGAQRSARPTEKSDPTRESVPRLLDRIL